MRARQQPIDDALIFEGLTPDKAILSPPKTFDFELLPWFDSIHLPEFSRQDNLPL
jgi:hypothetical protein